MRRKSGWLRKPMPNISNTSRSYQLAARQTPVTESISHSDSKTQHFKRTRSFRSRECRLYTTSKRGSEGVQSTAVIELNRMKRCSPLRKRHTSTIKDGEINRVGTAPWARPPGGGAGK